MSTPETKLTVKTTNGAYQPYSSITFNKGSNLAVLHITSEGRMICGEGLSTEEATQQAAKMLIDAFEERIEKMVNARVAADTARMDWLEKEALEDWRIRSINRASIDKAMKDASQ
jgi:Glu-tRNA(Gln) amidotransferase subunit E-like FAD-binding protein